MAQRSIVWKHFKINPNDQTVCICQLCNSLISRGGKTPKTFTTTNMMNHLKKFHPMTMETKESLKRSNEEIVNDSEDGDEPPSKVNKVQATLEAVLQKKKLWDINNPKAHKIHYLIGEMIATDLQPYSMVSDVGFNRLLKEICPNYDIPSRKWFTENIIPDIYQKVKRKVETSIKNVDHISLTTDIWTASTSGAPFLSVTGHWLSKEFEQQRAILRVIPFSGSHTGERIGKELNSALEDYHLSKQTVFLVLRDSAANMVTGLNKCGFQAQSCFIHTLQLIINETIFAQISVKNIVAINRNIVKHFNHSPLAVSKLTEIQEKFDLKKHKLIQDVSTRWNSTYYMLERNLEQRKALVMYAVDNDLPTLSSYQWGLVEKLVQLLKPFEEITLEASERKSTVSMIIPTIKILQLFLSKASSDDKFSGLQTTITELQASVNLRLSSYLENQLLCLSTFLDPRFKIKFQKDEDVMKNKIENWILQVLKSTENSEPEDESVEDNLNPSSSKESVEVLDSPLTFSKLFEELASSDTIQNDKLMSSNEKNQKTNASYKREFENYLSLSLLPKNKDPFLWWKLSKEKFPNLSKLALKYLSAPTSSVESERVFSTGGNIYEPTRNRLCPENAEMLMYLHHNLRILDFKYS